MKQSARGYFDVAWTPLELGEPIRIEIKASSEHPGYRFQQIRDPRLSGRGELDYDVLLGLGVTSATLEFWWIPTRDVIEYIESDLFTNQHGGSKSESGTFWVTMDQRARELMVRHSVAPGELRAHALSAAVTAPPVARAPNRRPR